MSAQDVHKDLKRKAERLRVEPSYHSLPSTSSSLSLSHSYPIIPAFSLFSSSSSVSSSMSSVFPQYPMLQPVLGERERKEKQEFHLSSKKERIIDGLIKITEYLQKSKLNEIIIPKDILSVEEVAFLRDSLTQTLEISDNKLISEIEELQFSLVSACCESSDSSTVRYLIDKQGADPIKPNKNGVYPIHKALLNRHEEVYQYLIELPKVRQETNWKKVKENCYDSVQKLKIPTLSYPAKYKDFFMVKEKLYRCLKYSDWDIISCKLSLLDDKWEALANQTAREEYYDSSKKYVRKSYSTSIIYFLAHFTSSESVDPSAEAQYNINESYTDRRPTRIDVENITRKYNSKDKSYDYESSDTATTYRMCSPYELSSYFSPFVYAKADQANQVHNELIALMNKFSEEYNVKIQARLDLIDRMQREEMQRGYKC